MGRAVSRNISQTFVAERQRKGLIRTSPLVAAQRRRDYGLSFRTKGAVLEKILLKEMSDENSGFVLVVKQSEREAFFEMCSNRWMLSRMEKFLSETCGMRKQDVHNFLWHYWK